MPLFPLHLVLIEKIIFLHWGLCLTVIEKGSASRLDNGGMVICSDQSGNQDRTQESTRSDTKRINDCITIVAIGIDSREHRRTSMCRRQSHSLSSLLANNSL